MSINKDFRMNERIRAREVRLIDENGNQLGVVPGRDAQNMARERGLDLIEVSPMANPPVCKIMDYGKYKYEQAKRDKEAAKRSKAAELKAIRMHPKTEEHDFQFKLRNTMTFLKQGDKVKVSVQFKGREITHPEFGRKLLDRIAVETAEMASVERNPSLEGKIMYMILAPK